MRIYKTCPYCGANLDPGQRCDCEEKALAGAANTNKSEWNME